MYIVNENSFFIMNTKDIKFTNLEIYKSLCYWNLQEVYLIRNNLKTLLL